MIAVVSPHLDDGVFSCGALLAMQPGSVVVTALAGAPPRWERVTPWDAACGFAAGDDVIATRRAEDREAVALLDAAPVWLDFCDAQYGPPPALEALAETLGRAVEAARPAAIFVPLGLFHSDHELTSEAARTLIAADPARRWFAYEDAIYRRIPDLTARALARLAAAGIAPSAVELTARAACVERKRRAVACYRSQLQGLSTPGRRGYEDAFAPERYWRLAV